MLFGDILIAREKSRTEVEMSFEIFCDSSANLPDELRSLYEIKVIPYSCIVNGTERRCLEEGVPFRTSAKKLYEEMRAGAEIKTSLINCNRIVESFAPVLDAGKDVLFVTIASGISGTYNQALKAKAELEKRYPSRKVAVKDSANASMGEGLLVLNVARLREMGESLDTCEKWLDMNTYKLNSYLTVADLKYLRRGGRVSLPLAIVGSLLNIKPILKADGGNNAKIVFAGREHGRKKALSALLTAFKENAVHPETQTVAITHADCEDEALELARELKALGVKDVIVEYYDVCTGAHVGPGTIALFFMGKDRKTPPPLPSAAPHAKPVAERLK